MHTAHLLTVSCSIPCISGGWWGWGDKTPCRQTRRESVHPLDAEASWRHTPWKQTPFLDTDLQTLPWRQTPWAPWMQTFPRHVTCDACWEANPPTLNKLTHRCKILPCSKLQLRAVIIDFASYSAIGALHPRLENPRPATTPPPVGASAYGNAGYATAY